MSNSVPDFKVRSMDEIVSAMISWIAGVSGEVTDFSVGSRMRTIVEAIAQEQEELYLEIFAAITAAIPELLFDGFQFPARSARRTTGVVTFSRAAAAGEDYAIPAETIVATLASETDESLQFETVEEVTIATGETEIEATVRALVAGAEHNVVAAAISRVEATIDGVEAVTNAAGFTTGSDAESADARAERFLTYIGNLARGTSASITQAILDNVEEVVGVSIVDSPSLTVSRYTPSGPLYEDVSAEANLPGGVAVSIFADTPEVGSCFYVGAARRFNLLSIHLRQAGSGITGVWEFWNGTAWATLTATDNTGTLEASDTIEWEYDDVTGWVASSVNGYVAYWVRFRLTSATMSTEPTLSYLWAAPEPGAIAVYAHEVTGTMTATVQLAVEQQVSAYRAAGVRATVSEPSVLDQDVTLALTLVAGADEDLVQERVNGAVETYITDLTVGERLSHEQLSKVVLDADSSVTDITWTTPTADVEASPDQLIRLDTMEVS